MGDKKYLIVSSQKSFGKRFDHFHHTENVFQPYSHHQTFFFKIEISKLKIFIWGLRNFHGIFRSQQIITIHCSRYYTCYFTPNKWVLICKNSYLEELIHILNIENVQFYKKWHFYHVSKWVNGWVIYKNSYFKVISMISLDHVEHFEYLR